MEEYSILECPHCKEFVYIKRTEINCGIFRHGVYKQNNQQMNPHAAKTECDDAKSRDIIWGCGKPFRVSVKDKEYIIEICDYI